MSFRSTSSAFPEGRSRHMRWVLRDVLGLTGTSLAAACPPPPPPPSLLSDGGHLRSQGYNDQPLANSTTTSLPDLISRAIHLPPHLLSMITTPTPTSPPHPPLPTPRNSSTPLPTYPYPLPPTAAQQDTPFPRMFTPTIPRHLTRSGLGIPTPPLRAYRSIVRRTG